MKELTIAATAENIETVTDFVNEQLEAIHCPMKAQVQIDIAIDELFGNIVHYAYGDKTGNVTVRVEMHDDSKVVCITFIDHGIPYNPLEKEDPDITLSAEDRKMGGLGIYLVKNSVDYMEYEYKDGKNILLVKKII